VTVAAHDDAAHLQVEHRKLDGRRSAVVAMRAVVRWHEGTDVTHQKQFARPGTRQQVGHQARVRTADEQGGGVLALIHQVLELLAVLRESIVVEATQAV
jgi:hypothetical protein